MITMVNGQNYTEVYVVRLSWSSGPSFLGVNPVSELSVAWLELRLVARFPMYFTLIPSRLNLLVSGSITFGSLWFGILASKAALQFGLSGSFSFGGFRWISTVKLSKYFLMSLTFFVCFCLHFFPFKWFFWLGFVFNVGELSFNVDLLLFGFGLWATLAILRFLLDNYLYRR